ncbi:hypothetical protein PGT21_018298 [Puccinia graminis f. sp. tritici]|uniref:Uncharacterized protein n=1 Tax=Puccinia graminis f. sp. tritici TaxID=56615 RepID=A0A5B0QBQ5_PUCGR|nr:hypothetical protein PGT21_018298 [Puccinia graminis f. sp. tritici]
MPFDRPRTFGRTSPCTYGHLKTLGVYSRQVVCRPDTVLLKDVSSSLLIQVLRLKLVQAVVAGSVPSVGERWT